MSGWNFDFGSNTKNDNSSFNFNSNDKNNTLNWGNTADKSSSSGWNFNTNTANTGFNWGTSTANTSNTDNPWNFGIGQNQNQSQNQNVNFIFPNQQATQKQAENPIEELHSISNAYNPGHPDCRFEFILYSKVNNPSRNPIILEKPPLIRPQLWEMANKNNPDNRNLICVPIRSYQQLKERSQICLAGHISKCQMFEKLSNQFNQLRDEIENKTRQEILDLKETQTQLSFRLLVILREYILRLTAQNYITDNVASGMGNITSQGIPIVSPMTDRLLYASRNTLTTDEIRMKNIFHNLFKEIQKLHQKFVTVDDKLQMRKERDQLELSVKAKPKSNIDNMPHVLPTNEQMKHIYHVLQQQQSFLFQMTKTVQQDYEDLNVIFKGIYNL